MRHRKASYKLGRTTAHRLSTLRNLATGVFEHGQIVTTVPRAKAVQPMVERIITIAKNAADQPSRRVAARRLVASKLGGNKKAFTWMHVAKDASEGEKEHINTLRGRAQQFFEIPDADSVERNRYGEVRKAPKMVKHIFDHVAPRFANRKGGYTRIVKLAKRRIGDAGELCVLQLVGNEEGPEIGGNLSTRRRIADKRTAFAAKLRKGFEKKD
ncbi:MAG: 50S ribosomal protein L17 [Phycisphaerales bacterium]